MKKSRVIFLILAGLTIGMNCIGQAPTKEKIYTLQANESMVYGENCFYFSDQGKDIFMVIQGLDGYYTFDNGVRKGPFKEMTTNLIKSCSQPASRNCAIYEPTINSNEDIFSKYILTKDDGSGSINFNGKTYGPFAALLNFDVSEDKLKFAAVVVDQNMSKKLILSTGKTIPIDGMVQTMKFSPDGNLVLMRVGIDYQSPNFDPSKITVEQITAISILTSDGDRFGPFNSEKVTDYDIWFTKTTGNRWFLRNGDDLLLDGKPFMKMPESADRCDIWFSPDCKRYAVSNYEKVVFSDGASIPYPIQTTLFYKDGKAFLRCITLENEREINVYTKAL